MPVCLIENDVDLDRVLVDFWLHHKNEWPNFFITNCHPINLNEICQGYYAYSIYRVTVWYKPGRLPEFFCNYNNLPSVQQKIEAELRQF
jgi:hypothetical protein